MPKKDIKDNILRIYNQYARSFEKNIGSMDIYNETYKNLLRLIDDTATILDLGCGPANVSGYLKDNLSGLEITGVDLSSSMIKIAEERIPDGQFILKNVTDFSPTKKYNCVISAFTIPFLSHEETFSLIKVIKAALNEKGYFYLSFIGGKGSGYESTCFTGKDALFFYYYSQEDILEMIETNCLQVVQKYDIEFPQEDKSISKEFVLIGKHGRK